MNTITMQAASDGSERYRHLSGTQISVVVRVGDRELLLQVDGEGNYTFDCLVGSEAIGLSAGKVEEVK
jgi:hypothetical protein